MTPYKTFEQLVSEAQQQSTKKQGAQVLIGISGFGGSGKSTLAKKLQEALGKAEVVSIDDFAVDHLSHRSPDWEGLDFARFKKEVLTPALLEKPVRYGVYDWKEDRVTSTRSVEPTSFLILEGCGIFQPPLMSYDFAVWVDYPLEEATKRGLARDRAQGATWDDNWWNIWMPNERDFFAKYRPDLLADFKIKPGI